MSYRSVISTMLLCTSAVFTGAAADSLTITKVDDIHIVNPGGVEKAVLFPNDGNAKMLSITGFKC